MSVQDPRHNSDHYMFLCCLCRDPLNEHSKYLGGLKRLPLQPPTTLKREDEIFAALQMAVPKLLGRDARKKVWILEATRRFVNERVTVRQDTAKVST